MEKEDQLRVGFEGTDRAMCRRRSAEVGMETDRAMWSGKISESGQETDRAMWRRKIS